MALINFGYRVDMTNIPAPVETGAYIVAYDLDGVLKQKDSTGLITVIGGTGGSGTGPVGPQGPTGPAGIGITGPTGPAGSGGSDQDNFVKQIIISNDIEYIKSEITNASIARNKLLNIFYNSNEKYCILSDDDTILLKKISVDDKDCVSYTNDYDKGFKQTERISSAFLVLKNIKEYFDETLDANQDLDFGLMLVNKGYSVYRYSSDIVNINRGQSSMFKNKMYALHKKKEALKIINKKYDNKNI